jgi:UDP-N-acetylglucosamine 2-epimerase
MGFFENAVLKLFLNADIKEIHIFSPSINCRMICGIAETIPCYKSKLVMMVGLNQERILQVLILLENQKRCSHRTLLPVTDYSIPNVSKKVVRIILGYTDFVKE